MKPFEADYYDGKTSVRHRVSLLAGGARLKLIGADVSEIFDLRRVRRSLRIANTPRWLYLPGGGACVTQDNDAVDRITRTRGYDRVLHTWESRPLLAALAVALVALGTWLFIDRGLPLAADEIARRIPREAETLLGESTLQGMDRFLLQPSTLPAARQQALRAKFAALMERAGSPTPYRLEFRASKPLGANAFALPAGVIVVLDDLVRLARHDEEVLGVLAHEVGHVYHRHTMRRLLEGSATALVIAGLTGDIASTTSLAAAAPTLLVQTKYSRDNEREADAYAVELMRRSEIDPRYLATMLGRLEGTRRFRAGLPDFLASHPPTEERKASALAASGHAGERDEPQTQEVAIPEPRPLAVLDPLQRQIIGLIEKRDYAELERLLILQQARYEQAALSEHELEIAFRAFRRLGPRAEPALKEWSEKLPGSYAAHTALGVYYLWRGIDARGTAYASDTSAEQLRNMQALVGRARPEFERSLVLTPKPYISHLSLITLSRYAGDRELGHRHYAQGLGIAPQSVGLRMAKMSNIEPRWGGSYKEMEALGQEAASELKDPAAAAKVAARLPSYRAHEVQRDKNYGEALRLYDEALRLDPAAGAVRCERSWLLSQLARHPEAYADAKRGLLDAREDSYCMERVIGAASHLPDHQEMIAVATLVVEVDAGAANALTHRGWAFEQLGQRDAAFQDYISAAKLGDAWAQLKVGMAYLEGAGVTRDDEQGVGWLRKSAAQGNADAKRILQTKER